MICGCFSPVRRRSSAAAWSGEGAHFAAYESRWMPLEERYIRQCGPEKGCQLVIDTTEFFP